MSQFRKWFKWNFSYWPDDSTLTILAKVVYRWAWNRAIFCSLLWSSGSFLGTLRGREYSISATIHRNVHRKDTPDLLSRFPKSSFGAAVGNSPPFLTDLPFHDFLNYEPLIVVEIFGKIVKRPVCQKRGWVADGCYLFVLLCEDWSPKSSTHTLAKYHEKTRPTFCSVVEKLRWEA